MGHAQGLGTSTQSLFLSHKIGVTHMTWAEGQQTKSSSGSDYPWQHLLLSSDNFLVGSFLKRFKAICLRREEFFSDSSAHFCRHPPSSSHPRVSGQLNCQMRRMVYCLEQGLNGSQKFKASQTGATERALGSVFRIRSKS